MIHISDEAARKVASLMAEQGQSPDKAFVRVAVKSGGCSGLSYDLDFVDNESEGDQAFEAKGVTILAEKKEPPLPDRHHLGIPGWPQWQGLSIQQS